MDTTSDERLRSVVAAVLSGVGVAGLVSALLGSPLFEPAYAAVAFGTAAAVTPRRLRIGCWLRDRLRD